MIDLRSDTVTLPLPAMRDAIAAAQVGDDVLDGDPTTRSLEARVAELLGHEAALFFPTGTQANQAAIGLHTRPGSEMVVEAESHIVRYEEGGAAALWGVQVRAIRAERGLVPADEIAELIRRPAPPYPKTSLIALENTHNAAGGTVHSPEAIGAIASLAQEHGIPVHLDGARLWNAAAALGVAPGTLATLATTVMVSFSKGLGCPVGACLAGSSALMSQAAILRRRLGGAMRQSGVVTAACHYALDHHLDRLTHDHQRARQLAQALRDVPDVHVHPPETNIVMLNLTRRRAAEVARVLRHHDVLLSVFGPARLRAVTHLGVDAADVARAGHRIAEGLAAQGVA